jgi:hypothetical protein
MGVRRDKAALPVGANPTRRTLQPEAKCDLVLGLAAEFQLTGRGRCGNAASLDEAKVAFKAEYAKGAKSAH